MKPSLQSCFLKTLAASVALLSVGLQSVVAQIKVACVGDSITAGYALTNPSSDSYPAQLQTLLGSGYKVENYGASGATVLKQSDNSVWSAQWSSWAYTNSMSSNPNIVVIMFGTNDSKSWNWNAANFKADYQALIAEYQALATHPKVYICLSPPVYMPNDFGTTFDPAFIQSTLLPAIRTVAADAGVTLIDNNTPLQSQPELFTDGVHPTTAGAAVIAKTVALAVTSSSDDMMIYSDQFHNGWGDSWSWMPRSSTTSPVFSGDNAMALTPSGSWQAWWLKAANIDARVYSALRFWANGGATGHTISIKGELNGSSAGLPTVSVNAPANVWRQFTIPLADLGLDNQTTLSGFQIGNGSSTQDFYMDELRLVAVDAPAVVNVNVNAAQALQTVNGNLFSINSVGWESTVNSADSVEVMKTIGAKSSRWPGGSWGDGWDWRKPRGYGSTDEDFIAMTKKSGADAFIIVNYGSGTAEEAADGVRKFNIENNCHFTHWEVGNEVGGSWEWDHDRPEIYVERPNIQPYELPYKPHDPWTYAMRFKEYYTAMKAVDPTIKIGAVADAFEDGTVNNQDHPVVNPRTGQTHYGWTPVMLQTMKEIGCTPDFLIHHRYGPKAGDTQNLLSSRTWADEAASLRQMLTDYLGDAGANVTLECTECGTTEGGGKQTISLPSGLYYADNLGQVMQTEFQSRVWWDMRNGGGPVSDPDPAEYGWRKNANGDYLSDGGIISGSGASRINYPIYQVASMMPHFATEGDSVVSASSDFQLLSVYSVRRTNGELTLLVVNKSSASHLTARINLGDFLPQDAATVYSYGIPQDEAARTGVGSQSPAQTSLTGVSGSFTATFAPFSVSVLVLTPGTEPPVAPTNLRATLSNSTVFLSWSAPAGAETYTVKRTTTSGGDYTTVATGVRETGFIDSDVDGSSTYYYVVSATNVYGTSPDSTEAVAGSAGQPRALYSFESNAQDGSGNGFNGTASSVSFVTGKVGTKAANFNGSSSYVQIPRSITDDFSIALWVKTTDNGGWSGAQWWAGKGLVDGEIGGGGADFGTSLVDGKFVLGVGATAGDTTVSSSANINDGTWHHVVATRENASGAMKVYVDGVLSGSGTGPTGSRTWPTDLRIGSLLSANNFFNGALDDVRLYDRILSDAEIGILGGTPPGAPSALEATTGTGVVSLSWTGVSSATGYYVKRSTTAEGGYTTIATTSDTSYADGDMGGAAAYYYIVTAVNAAGESSGASASVTFYTAQELWRLENFGSPDNSGDAADNADPDGDGWTNLQEYISGTDPRDPTSLLKISQMQVAGNDMILSFPSVAGRTYRLERSDTLATASWVTVEEGILGTGDTLQITDTDGATHTRRFYRLVSGQ